MNRLLQELRYFWQQVRDGYPRQAGEVDWVNRVRRLMAIELEPATKQQCMDEATTIMAVYSRLWPSSPIDRRIRTLQLGNVLHTRVNRGRATFTMAADLFLRDLEW